MGCFGDSLIHHESETFTRGAGTMFFGHDTQVNYNPVKVVQAIGIGVNVQPTWLRLQLRRPGC